MPRSKLLSFLPASMLRFQRTQPTSTRKGTLHLTSIVLSTRITLPAHVENNFFKDDWGFTNRLHDLKSPDAFLLELNWSVGPIIDEFIGLINKVLKKLSEE